jgi:hypothetical protein
MSNKRKLSENDPVEHGVLLDLVEYDDDAGVLRWRVTRGRAKAGAEVGSTDSDGYRICTIEKIQYKIHRLVWFFHRAAWPVGEIDHVDGDRRNNRISNLRDVSISKNRQNRPRFDNSTGFKGVHRRKDGIYFAQIQADGVVHHLGTFRTPEDAHLAYAAKARELHGEFVASDIPCG